jgi:hypothetical protein
MHFRLRRKVALAHGREVLTINRTRGLHRIFS